MGEARFIGPRSVEVRLNDGGTRHLAADTILINSGARPRVPDSAGPGRRALPRLDLDHGAGRGARATCW